jgi:purine-binding chemotaxis protein CheW
MRAHLFFRASGVTCAIPVEIVVETMRPLPTKPLGAAVEVALGVAIIRGTATLVLDAGRLFGGEPVQSRRYVTLNVGVRVVALAVEDVIGVGTLSQDVLGTLPPLLASEHAAVALLGARDRELLVVLQAGRLISDDMLAAALGAAAS